MVFCSFLFLLFGVIVIHVLFVLFTFVVVLT